MNRKRVVLALGTRPEAIKMAPVYRALSRVEGIEPLVFLTGQHREQMEQALSLFRIPIHARMEVMTSCQKLPDLAARILPQASEILRQFQADYVLVHGDTLSTFAVAWVAFLDQIKLGHVEAGLRSHNMYEPFPEEATRKLTDVLTDLDLAPTRIAKENLLREGKPEEQVIVTGQTGIDAILYAAQVSNLTLDILPGPYVTVTIHRRENWPILEQIAMALARVAEEHRQYRFVYPVHLNPIVRRAVWPVLEKVSNFSLLDPLEYGCMAALLKQSVLIITDSGGLQEEGAALCVPVVVLRNVTERPEGIETGILQLAGTDPQNIYHVVHSLLSDPGKLKNMSQAKNPYGDGKASARVAQSIAWRMGLSPRPLDWM